nr:type III effector HrpK domain-containing protein [Acetobacter farinalis]
MQSCTVKGSSSDSYKAQADQSDLSSAFGKAVRKSTDTNKDSAGPVSDQDADSYVDSSKYAKNYSEWDQLTAGSSDSGDQGKDIGRQYAAVQLLADNWQKWGLHDAHIDFSDPSTWSKLPPEAQKTLKVISRSPSMISALENTGAKGKKSTGVITLSQVKDFVKKSNSDLKTAMSSLKSYEKKNPDAGAMSLTLVRQAALVMANQTLIAGAGEQMQAGAADQRQDNSGIHKDNLAAVASDKGLGSALNEAANVMSQNAIFSGLDVAGNGPGGTGADGAVGRGNLVDWIKSEAPTSDSSFLSYLSENAIKQSLPDIDSKKIGKDIFENPQNYDAATKAAVLNQLENDESVMESGKSQGLWSGKMAKSKGLSSNYKSELADLQSKIKQLQSDSDVQKFEKTAESDGLKSIADSDPTLKAQISSYYNTSELTGASLNSDLNAKDSKGNGVSIGTGLQNFVSQTHTLDGLLGKSGADATNLTDILNKSGDKNEIEQAYSNEILNKDTLTTALQGVSTPDAMAQIISNYQDDNSAFSSVLGSDYTQKYTSQIQSNVQSAISDAENNIEETTNFLNAFCDDNGKASDSKIKAYVENAQAQNPEAFNATTAGSVIKEIKKIVDLVRQGYKINDAIEKYEKAKKDKNGAAEDPIENPAGGGEEGQAAVNPEDGAGNQAPVNPEDGAGNQAPVNPEDGAGNQVEGNPEGEEGTAPAADNGAGGKNGGLTSWIPSPDTVYSNGALHLTSSGLSAGVLAASIVQYAAGSRTATGRAGLAASSMQFVGGTAEGSSKLLKSILKKQAKKIKASIEEQGGAENADDATKAKKAANDAWTKGSAWGEVAGKELGAAGGIASGVMSLMSGVKDLKDGDKVDGGLNITTGSLDTLSGIAGAADGAVSAADAAGVSVGIAAGVAGTVAGLASGIAAGAGLIIGLVELIIQQVKKKKEEHNYFNQLSNLSDYGIDGSSESTKSKKS